VKLLVQEDYNINTPNNCLETPLICSINKDFQDICLILLESLTINVNLADSNHRTALHYASIMNFEHICCLLIQKGADIRAKDTSNINLIMVRPHFIMQKTRILKNCCHSKNHVVVSRTLVLDIKQDGSFNIDFYNQIQTRILSKWKSLSLSGWGSPAVSSLPRSPVWDSKSSVIVIRVFINISLN